MQRLLIIFICTLYLSSNGQEYQVFLDLTNVIEDRVEVKIQFDSFNLSQVVEYNMPTMVPGTYHKSNFGRLLNDVKAFDSAGKEIELNKLDINRWQIKNATDLEWITYWVDDTFDDPQFSDIFEPTGTNIEQDNFLINTFGFIGFLTGRENLPYAIRIKYPEHLYGVSPMERQQISVNEEVFSANNYFQLTDSPIMYSPPDTTSVIIDDTHVVVSVYSPSRDSVAEIMMESIEPTLRAQGEYLGGDLPVKSYAILIYLHENPTNSGSMGALEHSYSTVFSYPDIDPKRLARSIVDVTSHEFFHIITPLTIHSEEIGAYDFIEAKMSKHLWLYEGVTEYSSMRVQVMYDLITSDQFLDEILSKVRRAKNYNDTLPFTEMSLGALDEYQGEYTNVYAKGALIGMCLDLLLLHHSDGNYDIRKLLNDLGLRYGVDKSFKDEELFDEIAEISFPSTRDFFSAYVEGPNPLPLKEFLLYAGALFLEGDTIYENTLGGLSLGYDPDVNTLVVVDISQMNKFGKEMGYKVGDVLQKINGTKLTLNNYYEVMDEFNLLAEGDKIEVEVLRLNKRNKEKTKTLKSNVQKVPKVQNMRIEWISAPTEKQLNVRNAWLNKHELLNPEN